MSLAIIISWFNAQHVSDVNISILRSLWLICWVISWVVLLWFDVCWCYGVVWLGWSLHPDTTPPQPNHHVTPTHIVPEQYNPWNNSTNKSQVPEDGCINIRNMLSIKSWNNKASDIKLVSLYSTIKMMHGPININYMVVVNSICYWCLNHKYSQERCIFYWYRGLYNSWSCRNCW